MEPKEKRLKTRGKLKTGDGKGNTHHGFKTETVKRNQKKREQNVLEKEKK